MIERDELLKMAREVGLFGNVDIHTIKSFANAILERAALELYGVAGLQEGHDVKDECIKVTRALKTKE